MAHLSGFGLENFRVFKEYTWFDFAPITLLVGPNNSGKSSLIKALLLLKDNYLMRNIPVNTDYFNTRVFTDNEDFSFNMGNVHGIMSIKDILPHGDESLKVVFKFPFADDYLFSENLELCFSYGIENGKLVSNLAFKITSSLGNIISMNFEDNTLLLNLDNLLPVIRNGSSVNQEEFDIFRMNKPDKENLLFWNEYKQVYKTNVTKVSLKFIDVIEIEGYQRHISMTILEAVEIACLSIPCNDSKVLARNIIDTLSLKDFYPVFESLAFRSSYVPPYKASPKRFLDWHSDVSSIGNLIREIKFQRSSEGDVDIGYSVWLDFMDKWEGKFNLPGKINWVSDAELGITKIKIGDNFLSNLGFGLSQITAIFLGILELNDSLMSPRRGSSNKAGGILFLEEPEANLHPKYQSLLADMFAEANKEFYNQFLIETHSEYMIRKFQYLVAKGEMKPEDVVIYYFHDPNDIPKGEKHVKKITILDDGSLSDDFGPGFFDEAANLELELLKLKRNKGRQN